MKTDETQTKMAKDYSLLPIAGQLIGAAYGVHAVLSCGFPEHVYQRAMHVGPQLCGANTVRKPVIKAQFPDVTVGGDTADLLPADKIAVEIKTGAIHRAIREAPLLNGLRGRRIRLGVLINFGRGGV